MYKLAILGCENSHARGFMTAIAIDKTAPDVEVVGAFTEYPERGKKFNEDFGVPLMKAHNIRLSGGSPIPLMEMITTMKKNLQENKYGKEEEIKYA